MSIKFLRPGLIVGALAVVAVLVVGAIDLTSREDEAKPQESAQQNTQPAASDAANSPADDQPAAADASGTQSTTEDDLPATGASSQQAAIGLAVSSVVIGAYVGSRRRLTARQLQT
jgi:LPXTG-motif cell wall-anchored protein